jgi:Tol biopolymer transport system component
MPTGWCLLSIALSLSPFLLAAAPRVAEADLDLKACPYQLVCETHRDGNWELYRMNADGSEATNLTRTPQVDEMYPHVSPDGSKLCFVAETGAGDRRRRDVYTMNLDGTGRTKVADNAREPCWRPDGKAIAYLKGEFSEFTVTDYATKGLFIYDLQTRTHRQHPNQELYHLYNICWSPDGNWFVATVHAGMGYDHAILAIQANGPRVFQLPIPGCRPDLSADGRHIAWGSSDWVLNVADLDLTGPEPKLTNPRDLITSAEPIKVYHIDWSPDGKWVAFSRGPTETTLGPVVEMVGVVAKGWNLCVADATKPDTWQAITTDGGSYKEPDWLPIPRGSGQ